MRVVRPDGLASWGDEGFAADYPHKRRKRILGRINPGFLKPRSSAPNGLTEGSTSNVYGGHAYLVVVREAKP